MEFGFGLSADVAYNSLNHSTQAFIRDVAKEVQAGTEIRLEALDAPMAVAGAGAVAFGNTISIGGAFARNGVDSISRAYTQDTILDATSLFLQANTDTHGLAFADGGAGRRAASLWPVRSPRTTC